MGALIYIHFAVLLGIIIAVPLGVVLTRMKKGAGVVIGIVNIIQTLPSLAILAFLFRSSEWERFRRLSRCFSIQSYRF